MYADELANLLTLKTLISLLLKEQSDQGLEYLHGVPYIIGLTASLNAVWSGLPQVAQIYQSR